MYLNLSASKVDAFFGCQRLYYYRYVKKVPTPPNKYFVIGNIAHKALEILHKNFSKDAAQRKEILSQAFKQALKEYQFTTLVDTGLLAKRDGEVLRECMKNYLAFATRALGTRQSVYVEQQFYFDLGSIKISGRADRVDTVGNNQFIITDYKTSASVPSEAELKKSVQAGTYALWLRKQYKDAEIQVEYLYLKHLNNGTGRVLFDLDRDTLEMTIARYQEMRDRLNTGCKWVRNRNYAFCGICEHKKACEVEEFDA